jgi:hypothetical protein
MAASQAVKFGGGIKWDAFISVADCVVERSLSDATILSAPPVQRNQWFRPTAGYYGESGNQRLVQLFEPKSHSAYPMSKDGRNQGDPYFGGFTCRKTPTDVDLVRSYISGGSIVIPQGKDEEYPLSSISENAPHYLLPKNQQ